MAEIELTQGKKAIVDDEDYENLIRFKWYASPWRNTVYAVRDHRIGQKRFQLRMHSFIIGVPMSGFEVDHINGNGLDNRKINLRVISKRENQANRYYHREGKALVGASFYNPRKLWESRIYVNHKSIRLGYYKTQIEAHHAYKNALESGIFKENHRVIQGK